MNPSDWCSRIIRYSFYLLFILVPLILTPWNYELFEYNKMMITYALTAIIAGAWGVKMIAQSELKIAKTPLDIPIVLFVVSQLVSSLFSIDPHVSWLGYYSRFNGGMWSIVTYTLLYYAFVTNFLAGIDTSASQSKASGKKSIQSHQTHTTLHSILTLLKVLLATASIVALYGVAEHYGIDKHLWVQDVQSRVFSTMGQPNWLAAFLVAILPLSMAFALSYRLVDDKNKIQPVLSILKHGMWQAFTLLFFITLLYTKSRSGLIGFLIADVMFWGIVLLRHWKHPHVRLSTLSTHVAFAIVIFFNGSNIVQIDRYITLNGIKNSISIQTALQTTPVAQPTPTGPVLETGGTESGTIRKYVWQGAISAWKSTTKTFLVGTGTETFAFAFYQFRPAGHNLTSEWDFLYNKAHNEYLNYLATTGIFGLGSYLIFIGAFVYWIVNGLKRKESDIADRTHDTFSLETALFSGWISILVTNFFGFSVVLLQLLLFLFPAIVYVLFLLRFNSSPHYRKKLFHLPGWIMWAISIGSVVTVIRIGLFWYADVQYASGYRDTRSGQYARAKASLEKAIAINPGEPNYHDEYASALGTLAVTAYGQQQATEAAAFAKQSLDENNKAITISPQNINYWKTKTKLYYAFSQLDPALTAAAIESLNRATELSPNDPKLYYNLAILYGRGGDNTKAISMLAKSMQLKPNYHDAYYATYVFFTEEKKPAEARAILEKYMKEIDPADEQFGQILNGKNP